jgi:aryl-alcohol dehydrogenase-like predicted oxidoreductase
MNPRTVTTRTFGRTGWQVSEIGFGAWGIGGGQWGGADEAESMRTLHAALDAGINFFDTADVYGDGLSERLIARLRRERTEPFYVATKAGRRLPAQTVAGYSRENLQAFVDRSLENLAVERLDLLQLHCPPTEVYYRPEVFETLDDLVTAGKIRFYGVSVEKVEEAIKAIEYPHVQSVQIIFNAFRLRPSELFFEQAKRRNVAVIARVPLASGLLSGRFARLTEFPADDHRSFNRDGAMFDRGETFSGVDYETGLEAARYVMDKLDFILLMSVNPGFGGQKFIPSTLVKLREARRMIDESGLPIRLEVDGGVGTGNIRAIAEAGADTFVAGSAIFGAPDYAEVIAAMRQQLALAAASA